MSAYKLPIIELIKGEYKERTLITRSGFEIVRAWVAGIVTQKRGGKYLSFLVDDGTGSLRIRIFENPEKYDVKPGDVLEVAGYLREYNDRIYLVPDFVQKITPNQELLRRLEALKVLKELKKNPPELPEYYQKQQAEEGLEKKNDESEKSEQKESKSQKEEKKQKSKEEKKSEKEEGEKKEKKEEEKSEEEGKEERDWEAVVMEALNEEKTIPQLQKETGLSEKEVSDILKELSDRGEIFQPKPGRFLAI